MMAQQDTKEECQKCMGELLVSCTIVSGKPNYEVIKKCGKSDKEIPAGGKYRWLGNAFTDLRNAEPKKEICE